ncbi:PAS domain S-box protein [Fischerella sp. JS2]|uniref:PAS domain S-box protein n=1 Tax=Fischerella sp. JS2 TaxID=2597771 RepID=UPI0028E5A720|nr:PAS domain S-box protein [Fischerella sp. JS2]
MSNHRTVLVIGDSDEGNNNYKQQLQQDRSVAYRIISQQYNSSVLTLPQLQQIDGILLELRSPCSNSINLLRQLKEQMGDRCPPIIVIDGGDTKTAVQAFKNGAVDYLVRDQITPEDLRLAMCSAIKNAQLRQELQRNQEQFQTSVENMLDCFGIFSAIRDKLGQIVDFRIDYLNKAACENNQMPKAMQIGRGLCEIFPAHHESGLFDEYCRVVETGEPLIKDLLIYDDTFGDRRLVRVFDIRATRLNDGFVACWRDVTDRKRLELELSQTVTDLQQQQYRIQRLIDKAPIGIGIGSVSGAVKVINDTMLHLHGLTREEFEQQGMNWREFAPPELSEQTEQAMIQVQQQGFTPPIEKQLCRRDGTRLPIWICTMQWMDGTDEHVAFAVDLTQRKQAEAAIQQLNQELTNRVSELQTLLEILPVGIAIATDPGCTHMQSNAYIRQLLNIRPGDNISKSAPAEEQPAYRVFQNKEEVPAENLPMQVAARLGVEVRDAEFDILLPNGTVRQLLCYATPLRGDQNQIRGVIGAFVDITERNQDAAALKASQQRYRELAEAMPQMVWTADATGAVNYWNQRWYEYTGLSEAESMGLAGTSTVHPDERDRTLALWSQAIANGESFEIEYQLRRWDGEYHWFICRAIPTQDTQGQTTGWIGTITDIDNQKQLETRLLHEIVNHQRTEQELRRGEERLRLAQLAANAGHWDWEIETNRVFWSTEYYTLYGLDPAIPSSYENWLASILEIDRERVDREVRAALASNQGEVNIEYRIHHPIRGVRWLVAKGQTRFNAVGQPQGMSGFTFDITDRKQAEIALRQNQERLYLAMKAAKMGSWDWDIQTGKVNWSTNLEHLFGMASGSFDGQYKTFRAMIHPDDLPWVESAIHRAVYEREDYNIEFRFMKPDGTVRWALGLGRVFYDAFGNPVTMTGVDMDISERKQAEADLRASEERFRHMADNAPMMIWVTDATGYCTYLSQRWYEFTGQTEATGLGMGWLEAVHPDDRELSKSIFLDAIERQADFRLEYRLRRQDGEYRWAIDAASPWLGKDGEFKGYIGSVIDISDRKRAERELQESEARFRTLADNISQFAWMADENGWIFWYNQRWFDYTGTTLAEMEGWGWQKVHHPDHVEGVVEKFRHCVETGETWEDTFPLRGKDGQYRWFLSRAVPVLDEQGKVLRWFGTNTDITDRQQLLQQEQAAREAAERANRIKDEFLAVLSHELRSPLNPILGWTKLLQTRKFDETKIAQALTIIERNAKLQTQLIDDLLDIAKILRGKLSLNTTSVSLSLIVEAAIETVTTAAVAKSISLHSVLPNIGQVSGDAARLQQVVWNLLSNAIKFTPNGGRVDIRLQRVGNQAQITVSDTGKGIGADFVPYIFESFRQEDASITRKYGGLGLGLAIVRQLVEAHGGTITADSPGEGLGATFTVRLPLLNVAPQIQQTDELPQQELELTGIRVLAVDDDADARELLTVLLTQYGAEVLTVSCASEVLANLESLKPDVLVSDIGMPEVDGYTLIQQVRNLSPAKGGQIPAIALSAYARVDDHQKSISSGYQKHLTKPLEPEQLVQAVVALTHTKLNRSLTSSPRRHSR